MAFHVSRSVVWQAGAGTPIKYSFGFDADVSVTGVVGNTATINLKGSISVTNHPTNSRNSFAASDFAVLTPGDINVNTHPFASGTSYYQHSIPFLPDPQNTDQGRILVQFRGDTWISDPSNNNNRVSLYATPQGLLVNQNDQDTTLTFQIDISYEIPVPVSSNTPVLAWITSGADNSTTYDWMDRQVWVSWVDLDYRPGATLDTNTSVWKSHNRINGACHILSDTTNVTWHECKTIGGDIGSQGNPPLILKAADADSWYNQLKIGKE